ncbi:hypothetical protein JIQ42_05453 [Leishmania sp. Namibia]|uniref:hypothetical protein n=1 Tax=Leishmania sp. Namibia TaxID=2802991 RepID=UPI001B4DAB31|nr:hypothetical protein JIQ42_05453 [Leishmania sp. Namibia]
MPRTRDTRHQTQEMADKIAGVASQVQVEMSSKAQDAPKAFASAKQDASDAAQNGVQNAMNTMQSYVHEGQRIASEQKAHLQEAVKKVVNVAHEYVEDARKIADPYVESAKAKVDSAKASVENARHSAQNAVDNAKEQVTAVRTKVTEKTQPYVSNYQEFDVTKTAAFHVLTHVISTVLYMVWRVTLMIPSLQHMIDVIHKKEADVTVAQNCAAMVQKVPIVGPRTVEVVTVAVSNVSADLREQVSQYHTMTQRFKAA